MATSPKSAVFTGMPMKSVLEVAAAVAKSPRCFLSTRKIQAMAMKRRKLARMLRRGTTEPTMRCMNCSRWKWVTTFPNMYGGITTCVTKRGMKISVSLVIQPFQART